MSIPSKTKGSIALFTTRTPTKDEIRDLFDERIILTDSNTWDPESLSSPREMDVTSNESAVQKMKEKEHVEILRVCATMARDAGYTEDSGDQRLLSGISTALTDETLLPRIINRVHIANTT